jgi:crotonobetainyl-CoA:carnitine CoA-transferase CaiB-like acyl-CoA transferase
MSEAPLSGVRVLDLTRNLAGPFATMHLGDLGADVVKIETPTGGDDTRHWAPVLDDGSSGVFVAANRNKRSVAVDLDHPDGADVVRRLAARADVLVESFRPGSLARRGLGYEQLSAEHPGLVYCSVSAFGGVGPRASDPGYDPVLQAATGIMELTGEPERPPVRLSIAAIDLGTALWATIGILAALTRRAATGRGAKVDASLFETSTWWLSFLLSSYELTGVLPQRSGSGTPILAPYELFPTADSDVFVAAGNDHMFRQLVEVLDRPELADDPRFATNQQRVANRELLREVLSERFRTATTADWIDRLTERSVPCTRVHTIADLLTDPQTDALAILRLAGLASAPDLRLVDLPVRRDGTRAERWTPPPRLGEHTDEVLAELGLPATEIARLRATGAIR